MSDLLKMRQGVLRELKNIRYFFDQMEKGVKTRDPVKVSRAYIFIKSMVHHMNDANLPEGFKHIYHDNMADYYGF